jgi:hypothetical protein
MLAGPTGNAYYILGATEHALASAGALPEEVREYVERATSGDYDNLLAVTREYVELETV